MRVRKCRNSLYGRQLPSVVSRVWGVYDPDSLTCLIFDPAKIESSRFVLCSAFLPKFAQYGCLLAFSPASFTLPFIFDFGVKIARTLCAFCTVLISGGHLSYPRVFFFKTAVVIGLFAVKINAAWRAFCTVLGGGRVFTLPRTFFFKILDSRLTFEPDIQFSIFA